VSRANLDATATVGKVNAALRSLGFTTDELEFVRGHGYCYVTGSVANMLEGDTGLYGAGAYVSHCTVRSWVEEVLHTCALGLRWSADEALRERVQHAGRAFGGVVGL
jgi:hypothetical protein